MGPPGALDRRGGRHGRGQQPIHRRSGRPPSARLGAPHEGRGWRYWLDELFLSPRWGFIGSLAVFAAVLFVVFYVSGWIDSETSARLVAWVAPWQPESTAGVVGRAVVDGLITDVDRFLNGKRGHDDITLVVVRHR